jgi:hypothetical protein
VTFETTRHGLAPPIDAIRTRQGSGWHLFSPRQAGLLAVQGWLASRLVIFVVALVVAWTSGRSLADTFNQWDVVHFSAIATQGYTTLTESAFFPGMPLAMAFFHLIGVSPLLSGTLISVVGSGLAAWALYRLAGGSTGGTVAVWAWSFAPMAVFTFVPYSEAVFCACGFWAFLRATEGRWAQVAWLAGAACLFRVSGLFLIGALGLVALSAPGQAWRDRLRHLACLLLPVVVLFGYVLFLRLRFGSWTAWFEAQSTGWGRSFHWPWEALRTTLMAAGITSAADANSIMFRWELFTAVIGVVTTAWCLARRRWAQAGWVAVQLIALSCQIWLISLSRTILLWFPIFLGLGALGRECASRRQQTIHRIAVAALIGVESVAMIWWAHRFFTGAWAS